MTQIYIDVLQEDIEVITDENLQNSTLSYYQFTWSLSTR